MPRGGKRTPSPRTPPGGPGKFSRRTDGQQVATPGIGGPGPGGESSLEFGDVQKLEASQKSNPLPVGVQSPRAGGAEARRPTGSRVSRGGPPEHLLTMDPEVDEPTTSGLDIGDGAGSNVLDARIPSPDKREQALEYLWLMYRNNDAFAMLNSLREERATRPTAPTASAVAPITQGPPLEDRALPSPAEA